jgi:hypothetical protein
MTSETRVFGKWQSVPSEDSDIAMGAAVIGSPDGQQFALAVNAGNGWITAVRLDTREDAHVATEYINRLATELEYARIGDIENAWGQSTSHPGVEWITATTDDTSIEFQDRLALGMARLWIVPSTDGETFGLLAPDSERHELGLFDSEAAALTTVQVFDALSQQRS